MLEGRSCGSVAAFGCCCLVIWHFCVFGVLIVGTLPFPHPCCFPPYCSFLCNGVEGEICRNICHLLLIVIIYSLSLFPLPSLLSIDMANFSLLSSIKTFEWHVGPNEICFYFPNSILFYTSYIFYLFEFNVIFSWALDRMWSFYASTCFQLTSWHTLQ